MNHTYHHVTDAEVDRILRILGEPASVARASHGYTGIPRRVVILGRAEVVRPGQVILAVDEEGVWTRDCRVDAITDIAMVDGGRAGTSTTKAIGT